MCDPLLIASAALTVGSVVANQQAAQAQGEARDAAINAERQRQNRLNREGDALNFVAQDRYQDFGGQQERKATNLGDYFAQQAAPVTEAGRGAAILPRSASNLVVAEEERQLGKAAQFGAQQNAAMGNLRSFGDVLGGLGRDQARDAAALGTLGGFKQGSQAVFPLELGAANQAGGGWRTAGGLLGAAGNVGLMAGLGGSYENLANMFAAPTYGSLGALGYHLRAGNGMAVGGV